MYSCDSVLKAARLYPSQEIKATNNINGEPAPRKGFFIRENAEAMDEVLQKLTSNERVLVPSHINITGWKEYDADAYEQLKERRSLEKIRLKPLVRTERS